jgi:hemolysin activation/secretion protein
MASFFKGPPDPSGGPFIFPILHPPMKATAAVIAAVLLPAPAFGIGAEDTTRPTPPPEGRAPEKPVATDSSTRGAVKAGEDQELLPALKGMVISNSSRTALALQQKTREGIRVDGFPEKETAALENIARAELGKPVSLRSLDRLTSKFEAEFRSSGRLFLRISFPPQEITSGVIALRITPATAGTISVKGKPAFGMDFAVKGFRSRPDGEISTDTLLEDLDWLNENPLRRASISFADGTADDALDLTLRLTAEKAWRVYGGIDNQLSESLGDERIFIGYQHGDVFKLDHRFTGQYTSALEIDRLQGISSSYEIPLPIRHLLAVSAGYTESESDVAGPLDQSGEFTRVALGYIVPLRRWNGISQEWRSGMEFRNNDYLFTNNTSQTVRFFQLGTGWKGKQTDRLGSSRVELSLAYSPGQGILGSEDADFVALGGGGAEALIARMDAERTLKLGGQASLIGRLRGQWADSDLLASDQISAAGATRVRGFDEVVGYADNGLVGTLEVQSKAWETPQAGDFIAAAFLDGAVLDRDLPTDAGELLSTGVGIRWRMADHFSAKADLGIPLTYPDSEDGDPVLHFSATTTW